MTAKTSDKKRYYNNAPGMFIVMPVEVLLDPRLTDQERRIMMCLCRYANSETGQTQPCYETITECTGISRSNASNAVSSLVAKGWVVRKTRGRGLPNVYYIQIPEDVEFRTVTSKRRSKDAQAARMQQISEKIGISATSKRNHQSDELEAAEVLAAAGVVDEFEVQEFWELTTGPDDFDNCTEAQLVELYSSGVALPQRLISKFKLARALA
ncbi:helix-turn-helix domain-containing protein [Janthinobacterium sp. ROICE36]|uniref:helix-turn-helix domain-containing protein n=1 Tax=Janthinobacterium sp. ROICE36 TaxID=2048670 RepID=UPI0015E07FAE|nr:helix-turn-helix domain-containing protein [Janthinobacterium sp. ROICE36]